jgi:hypothetical protein
MKEKEPDIAEIRELLADVTARPWSIDRNAAGDLVICCKESNFDRGYIAVMSSTNEKAYVNACLIAAAPYIIKTLSDRIEVLEKALIDAGKTEN